MLNPVLFSLVFGVPVVLGTDVTTTVSVSVPTSIQGASRPISRSFPGFGFDSGSVVEFMGKPGHPNQFSKNLIDSVFSRTGGTPILRVGGTDGDVGAEFVPTGDHIGTNGQYSPVYFESFKNFLPGVRYIFQVPFRPMNLKNTVAFFKAGYKSIGLDHIESIAIGNEEGQLYTSGSLGPKATVNYKAYVNKYLDYEKAIVQSEGLPNQPLFEIADGASRERDYGLFNPQGTFNNGINDNGRVNAVAYHLYQPREDHGNLQQTMMNHTNMKLKVKQYVNDIEYMNQNHDRIPYILSEIGNGEDAGAPIQTSFGATLWQANIMMYCTTLGVGAMHFQSAGVSGHNEWVGGSKPEVRPAFYAHPFVADFIGNSQSSTVSKMIHEEALFTGYAAYDGANLERIALVNFELWPVHNTPQGFQTTRHSRDVTLNGLPSDVTGVRVQQLNSAKGGWGGHAEQIEYDGYRWTTESNGTQVRQSGFKPEVVNVDQSGSVTVNIQDSEALLLVLLK